MHKQSFARWLATHVFWVLLADWLSVPQVPDQGSFLRYYMFL